MSVIGYFLARSLAGPVQRITQMAESLASGQMNARVDPHTHIQEMNRLAEVFNNMATRLQVYVDELRSFVANASHELRTPLTSIKLRVEALRSGALDDPPVTERFLAEVEGEVDRMTSMVNDLLDLSRIEAGLNPDSRAPIDLAAVADDVYEAFKARADRAGIELGASIKSSLPPVWGNEDQLRRVLYNLMDNAIKYTPSGGRVEISLEAGKRDKTVLLKVSDTGFGIAPAHLPHIFERFYRVEATRPRFGPSLGSGLGLPIAKSIAEAHSGQIGVSSMVGKGTTFWVELPTSKMPVD
jgi:signal transduction histidine kinase